MDIDKSLPVPSSLPASASSASTVPKWWKWLAIAAGILSFLSLAVAVGTTYALVVQMARVESDLDSIRISEVRAKINSGL